MSEATTEARSGSANALVRTVLVVLALLSATLLISATHHLDDAPTPSIVSTVGDISAEAQSDAGASFEVVSDQLAAGVAVTCVVLALCCVLALAVRRLRPSATTVRTLRPRSPRPTFVVATRRATPGLHQISISRT